MLCHPIEKTKPTRAHQDRYFIVFQSGTPNHPFHRVLENSRFASTSNSSVMYRITRTPGASLSPRFFKSSSAKHQTFPSSVVLLKSAYILCAGMSSPVGRMERGGFHAKSSLQN